MNWLQEAFLEPTMVQAVIIISLVSALGLYLGRIKIFGISLGITFVFFAGILLADSLPLQEQNMHDIIYAGLSGWLGDNAFTSFVYAFLFVGVVWLVPVSSLR